MDMQAAYEIAKKLRDLVRAADTENWSKMGVLNEILDIAEHYVSVAEAIEIEMIVQMQRDWVEAN